MSLLLNRTEMDERVVLVELQEKVRVDELGISEEVLKVHKVAPALRGRGSSASSMKMQTESAIGSVTTKKLTKLRRSTTNSTWILRPTASTGST